MALVNARLTRERAGRERGTIFRVDENDPRIYRGTLEVTEEEPPEEVDTSDVDSMKGPELREQLEAIGLDTKGKVSELKDRLKQARGGKRAESFDFRHQEPGAGSEEPGEGVNAIAASNADLVNLDEGDRVEGGHLFAGDKGEHPWDVDTKLGPEDGGGEEDEPEPGKHLGNELFAGDVTQNEGEHPLGIDTIYAPTEDDKAAGF